MKEIIADLKDITDDGGDTIADHGVVQRIEGALLDMAGKRVRIRITEYRPFYPYKEVYRRQYEDGHEAHRATEAHESDER